MACKITTLNGETIFESYVISTFGEESFVIHRIGNPTEAIVLFSVCLCLVFVKIKIH